MTGLKILLTDGLNENGQAILRESGEVDDRPDITAEDLLKVAGEYDAMIVRGRTKVSAAVFEAAARLKVVGRAGVGVDNIDLEAAKAHGVTVVNAPRSTSRAVAELTLALMLSLARSVPRADATMKAGQWIKKQLEGVELFGKTIGIIGLGNIGTIVLHCSAAMGMKGIAYDPWIPEEEIRRRGAEPVLLPELYAQSDFISLHIPLTPDTKGLISQQAFSQMKHGVRLICAARGGVIDEEALLEALNSGQVAGAALDVYAKEPPGATALLSQPNVVATPHIGAQTEEAQARASADIASEVLAALRGDVLRWRIV
jgi:D-3-phosphoglycerate dehydrogenase / 2-oxoglutarate reductase